MATQVQVQCQQPLSAPNGSAVAAAAATGKERFVLFLRRLKSIHCSFPQILIRFVRATYNGGSNGNCKVEEIGQY
ncbi:hypothetical protein FRX31_012326 [Thalictrum thalictroides]|uniref:Uncharacterized protein n=1 Tax=Thalictrum thalictroides TaxID=46969 RepID=A0A7J6WM85_THATH|nr:hypothetical protein FRX31_012326 [Thalictrum thalictroides]